VWLEAKLAVVSGKSKIAEAIRSGLSRREGLTRFVDDGHIEIDSNFVERAIRPIAMTDSFCTSSSRNAGGAPKLDDGLAGRRKLMAFLDYILLSKARRMLAAPQNSMTD
jgi:hypothetical protein